jgi:hypothetical protein
MENLVSPLVNLGIGGVLLAVFLLYGHHLVTKIIPNLLERREKDLEWTRAELEKQRVDFLAALNKQHADHAAALRDLHLSYVDQLTRLETRWNNSEARWEKAVNDICTRLEQMESSLKVQAVSLHGKSS